jgi:regulatory protein
MTEGRKKIFATPATISDGQKAMNSAVRILTNRDHSKYELKQKLQQRDFASKVIDTVIAECERLNYINDERTARVYISQLNRKCFGKHHIKMALKKKGLRGAAIENILLQKCTEDEERKKAGRLLEKKLKTVNREKEARKKRDHIYRFLYSRGFSRDLIADLIRSVVN